MEIAQLCKHVIISCSNPYTFLIREIYLKMAGENTLGEPKLKVTR